MGWAIVVGCKKKQFKTVNLLEVANQFFLNINIL